MGLMGPSHGLQRSILDPAFWGMCLLKEDHGDW